MVFGSSAIGIVQERGDYFNQLHCVSKVDKSSCEVTTPKTSFQQVNDADVESEEYSIEIKTDQAPSGLDLVMETGITRSSYEEQDEEEEDDCEGDDTWNDNDGHQNCSGSDSEIESSVKDEKMAPDHPNDSLTPINNAVVALNQDAICMPCANGLCLLRSLDETSIESERSRSLEAKSTVEYSTHTKKRDYLDYMMTQQS